MDDIKTREMTINDYECVIELWTKIEGIGLSEADSKENISKYLNRNQGLSFVAEKNNKILGAVLCGHDGRRGFIHHLAICKEYRMNGLGKSLIVECKHKLRQEGINKCHLFVFKDNENGSKFWSEIGWQKRDDLNIMSQTI